jgi:hypothetical protein
LRNNPEKIHGSAIFERKELFYIESGEIKDILAQQEYIEDNHFRKR